MSSISDRKKKEIRKSYREGLDILKTEMANIKKMQEKGVCLRDQQLRFLNSYPETRMKYEGLVAESLKDEATLPEGRLKEFIDKFEWMIGIGKMKDIVEAMGYYRCEKCGELHAKSRECIYAEYQKYKDKEVTDVIPPTKEEDEEMKLWDKASDEAWELIEDNKDNQDNEDNKDNEVNEDDVS